MKEIRVRSEKVSDIEAIYQVIKNAFGREDEAKLVNTLRDQGALTFSLVAEDIKNQSLLGHLAFSMVNINGDQQQWPALGLAPVSVMSEFQNQGIGSALINFWFEHYADVYFNAVILLGPPNYYSRFGFTKAADAGLVWEFECPEETFQVRELKPGFLDKVQGVVCYHPAFSEC